VLQNSIVIIRLFPGESKNGGHEKKALHPYCRRNALSCWDIVLLRFYEDLGEEICPIGSLCDADNLYIPGKSVIIYVIYSFWRCIMTDRFNAGGSASFTVFAQMQKIDREEAERKAREMGISPEEIRAFEEQKAARKEQISRFLDLGGPSEGEAESDELSAREKRAQLAEKVYEDVGQDKLSDDELERLFGDQAASIRNLMKSRDDVKLSDLITFRGDQAGLSHISKLLTDRKDLNYSDLVNKSADGKVSLTWAVTDPRSHEIMEKRRDIKPKELTALFGALVKNFDNNPQLARKAYTETARLLVNRPDITPESAGKMVLEMGQQLESIEPTHVPGSRIMLNNAKMDMLGSSVDLLVKRNDINPEDVTKLSGAMVASFGNKMDPLSLSRVSRSFKDATEMMCKRKDVSIDQVTGFLGALDSAITGSDTHSLENKASIFRGTCDTMARKPDVGFDTMHKLLAQVGDYYRDHGFLLKSLFTPNRSTRPSKGYSWFSKAFKVDSFTWLRNVRKGNWPCGQFLSANVFRKKPITGSRSG